MNDAIPKRVHKSFLLSLVAAAFTSGAAVVAPYTVLKAVLIALSVGNALWAILWALMIAVDLIDDIARRESKGEK